MLTNTLKIFTLDYRWLHFSYRKDLGPRQDKARQDKLLPGFRTPITNVRQLISKTLLSICLSWCASYFSFSSSFSIGFHFSLGLLCHWRSFSFCLKMIKCSYRTKSKMAWNINIVNQNYCKQVTCLNPFYHFCHLPTLNIKPIFFRYLLLSFDICHIYS